MTRALLLMTSSVLCLTLCGCYTTARIKPTELPKLNGGMVGTIVGGDHQGHAAVSVGHVEGADGRMVEVNGEFDATVVQNNGDEVEFTHPVLATVKESTLEVAGGNRARTRFELSDVSEVETSTYNANTTIILVGCTLIAVMVGIVAAIAIDAQNTVDENSDL
jgi:hypothetical protein